MQKHSRGINTKARGEVQRNRLDIQEAGPLLAPLGSVVALGEPVCYSAPRHRLWHTEVPRKGLPIDLEQLLH